MPKGFVGTVEEFYHVYGARGATEIARWLAFILVNNNDVHVEVPSKYSDHWLVKIARSVPMDKEEFDEWVEGLEEDDYHPLKNEETLAEIRPLGQHAFIIYTTLIDEPWFPREILAYLYAISDQRADDGYTRMDMNLDSAGCVLDIFGRSGLFKIVMDF